MEKRSELENRQFALERLAQEGKPVCEIARKNEVVLFQAVENEVDKATFLEEIDGDREFLIYENEYQTARIVLDAITAVCLSDWLEQLKRLNINDSLTWRFAQLERQEKKNG